MNAKFLQSPEKKKILEELNNHFGIESIPYLLIRTGNEKIRAYSGSLSKDEIMELSRLVNIEIIGEYFLKQEGDLRLSLDATQMMKSQITKSIIDIDDKDFNLWIRGQDIDIKTDSGVKVIRYKGNLIGCGKSNGQKIFNYIPKERRLRK